MARKAMKNPAMGNKRILLLIFFSSGLCLRLMVLLRADVLKIGFVPFSFPRGIALAWPCRVRKSIGAGIVEGIGCGRRVINDVVFSNMIIEEVCGCVIGVSLIINPIIGKGIELRFQ